MTQDEGRPRFTFRTHDDGHHRDHPTSVTAAPATLTGDGRQTWRIRPSGTETPHLASPMAVTRLATLCFSWS